MQGEAIVNRILSDADERAKVVIEEATLKAKELVSEAEIFSANLKNKAEEKASEREDQIIERYKTLARIEGNKILINKKQEILKDLKKQALDVLLGLDKSKKLELIEKLLNNFAEKEEKLLVNIVGITNEEIESLEVVKKLKLDVEKYKGEQQGLILESKSCDKNLLFEDLINQIFEQNRDEINNILF